MARKWNGKPIVYPKLREFHEGIAALGFRSTDCGLAFVDLNDPSIRIDAVLLDYKWLEGRKFCNRKATLKLLRNARFAQREGDGALEGRHGTQPTQNIP